MRRVVLVLADGLRPDAITPTDMPSLDALARTYTTAFRASTVRPSRTVAALASLATGVAPGTHGLIEPGLGFLARLPTLRPLARELSRGGVTSQVVASELLPSERAVRWALTKAAGLGKYRSAGLRAREVARAAQAGAPAQSTGLVFVYLNDCDVVVRSRGAGVLRGARVDSGLHTDGSAGRGGGLMRWLTHLGGARVTIGLGLGLIAVGEQLLGLAALFALTTSHMAVQVLKRAVARPRPCDASGRPLALIDLPDPFSFPSGHAAAASAVGGTIAIAHPVLAPLLLPLAALIAASRVSLRVHHVGDVIGGALLGLIAAIGAALLILH